MLSILFAVFQMSLSSVSAGPTTPPDCLGSMGEVLPVIDDQVLKWKTTTANQFLARAHVLGKVSDIYPDHNGHTHFAIVFDANPKDNLEIIYNQTFGALPHLAVGMTVEACGDYITSDAATTQYPASPAGAIIHWIHRNPSAHGHPSGYLMIDGALFGQGNGSGALI